MGAVKTIFFSSKRICTHATLRFACEGLHEKKFDNTLIAIDEFHQDKVIVQAYYGPSAFNGVIRKAK